MQTVICHWSVCSNDWPFGPENSALASVKTPFPSVQANILLG